jgi:hypothetical protein
MTAHGTKTKLGAYQPQLDACPFCHGRADISGLIDVQDSPDWLVKVECWECGAEMSTRATQPRYPYTKHAWDAFETTLLHAAATRWNTRKTAP